MQILLLLGQFLSTLPFPFFPPALVLPPQISAVDFVQAHEQSLARAQSSCCVRSGWARKRKQDSMAGSRGREGAESCLSSVRTACVTSLSATGGADKDRVLWHQRCARHTFTALCVSARGSHLSKTKPKPSCSIAPSLCIAQNSKRKNYFPFSLQTTA